MSGVLIAGVGTDVGKTYIACALLRCWRARGIACAPLKPVLSGYSDAHWMNSDAAQLMRANGQRPTLEAIAAMSPWRYSAPLAPPAAAKLEGKLLDFDAIVSFCRGAIDGNGDAATVIETAGGVMSPLTGDRTMLELIAALNAPVIFVTGTYLGAVSHTLTGLETLSARNHTVALLIVNESPSSVGLNETCEMIGAHHPRLATLAVKRGGGVPANTPLFL